MLTDPSFRKTAKCSYHEKLILSKNLPPFPARKLDLTGKTWKDELQLDVPCILLGNIGIKLPDRSTKLSDVARIVGPSITVNIIEVGEQHEIVGRTIGEYAEYIEHHTLEHKILNMITLEFSGTPLNNRVQSPSFVRQIDWVDIFWPMERRMVGDYPKVQKYCLSGMAGSYTDFHIDFGGTSVWYHIMWGRKRFYLIPPTTENLKKYQQWTCSAKQASTFFGDLVHRGECFQYDLTPGETLIIPSGWIHAVYTPEDSLVFGGNFLHSFSILRQLQVYLVETNTRVGKQYRYPLFRQLHWYVLCTMLSIARALYVDNKVEKEVVQCDEEQFYFTQQLRKKEHLVQFVFLVKQCEEWLPKIHEECEEVVFESTALQAGCKSVFEVTSAWWKILHSLSEGIDEQTVKHVERVQQLSTPSLDLLDDAVIGCGADEFHEALLSLCPHLHPQPESAAKELDAAPVLSSAPSVNSDPSDVQHWNRSLKLKFTAKPPADRTAATTAEESKRNVMQVSGVSSEELMCSSTPSDIYSQGLLNELPSSEEERKRLAKVLNEGGVVTSSDSTSLFSDTPPVPPVGAKEPKTEEAEEASMSLKFKLPTRSKRPAAEAQKESKPSSFSASHAAPKPNIVVKDASSFAAYLAKTEEEESDEEGIIKFRHGVPQPHADNAGSTARQRKATTLKFKYTAAPPKKPPLLQEPEIIDRETESGYVTRGVRLSSEYLKQVTDVDVRGDDFATGCYTTSTQRRFAAEATFDDENEEDGEDYEVDDDAFEEDLEDVGNARKRAKKGAIGGGGSSGRGGRRKEDSFHAKEVKRLENLFETTKKERKETEKPVYFVDRVSQKNCYSNPALPVYMPLATTSTAAKKGAKVSGRDQIRKKLGLK